MKRRVPTGIKQFPRSRFSSAVVNPLPLIGPFENLAPVNVDNFPNIRYTFSQQVTSSRTSPIMANNIILDDGVILTSPNFYIAMYCNTLNFGFGSKLNVDGMQGGDALSSSKGGKGGNGASGGGGGYCDTLGGDNLSAESGDGDNGAEGPSNGNCSFPAQGGDPGLGYGKSYIDVNDPYKLLYALGGQNSASELSTGPWGRAGMGATNTCASIVSAPGGPGGAGLIVIVCRSIVGQNPTDTNFSAKGNGPGNFFDAFGNAANCASGGGSLYIATMASDGNFNRDLSPGSSCCGTGGIGNYQLWKIAADKTTLTAKSFGNIWS